MSNEPTKYTEQALLNYTADDTVSPPILQFAQRTWNGTSWVKGGGISLAPFDYVSMVISPATTETYTFKTGGAAGTTTNTVVIVYTDSTRADISTVTRT